MSRRAHHVCCSGDPGVGEGDGGVDAMCASSSAALGSTPVKLVIACRVAHVIPAKGVKGTCRRPTAVRCTVRDQEGVSVVFCIRAAVVVRACSSN